MRENVNYQAQVLLGRFLPLEQDRLVSLCFQSLCYITCVLHCDPTLSPKLHSAEISDRDTIHPVTRHCALKRF